MCQTKFAPYLNNNFLRDVLDVLDKLKPAVIFFISNMEYMYFT